jgi:hypothetical protein
MAETPIEFPKGKASAPVAPLQGTGFRLPGTPAPTQGTFRSNYSSESVAPSLIEIDKLYPAEKESKSEVIAALGLLADAISLLEKARVCNRGQQLIEADRHTQRFETLLIPLFARRAIGDGFALTINSLHFALINQHGKPLTFDQLTTIWRVLKELRNSPFVSFNQALGWVEEFEGCQLKVDPPVLGSLIEDFESE